MLEGPFWASSNSFHFPSLASLKSPAYSPEVLYFPYKPISSKSDELLSLASSIRESFTLKLVASTVKLPPLTVKSPATLRLPETDVVSVVAFPRVVFPATVRLPETDVVSVVAFPRVVFPFIVKLLNVTLLVVPTSCPILIAPVELSYETPVPWPIAVLALALVKYRFVEPSVISSELSFVVQGTFIGNLTGNVTGNITGNITGG